MSKELALLISGFAHTVHKMNEDPIQKSTTITLSLGVSVIAGVILATSAYFDLRNDVTAANESLEALESEVVPRREIELQYSSLNSEVDSLQSKIDIILQREYGIQPSKIKEAQTNYPNND